MNFVDEFYDFYKPDNFLVTLAVSEICNIKCKFCYHFPDSYDVDGYNRFYHEKSKKFLKFSDFVDFFDNIDVLIDEIALSGYGEPLLNPEFLDIFEYIVNNNRGRIKRIFLPTNGVLMCNDMAEKIINIISNSDIKIQVLFSINAASPEVYKDVCCEDFYDIVVKNAEDFIRLTDKYKITSQIYSSVQMVIVKENMHETEIFLDKWQSFFKDNNLNFGVEKACTCGETIVGNSVEHSIAFVMAILGDQKDSSITFDNSLKNLEFSQKVLTLDDTTRLNENHMEIKSYIKRKPCSALWRSPVIMTNGDLCICTRDLLGEFPYGNIRNNKFSEVFWSEKANSWRKNQLSGDFNCPSICFYCQGFEGLPVSNNQLDEFCLKFDGKLAFNLFKKRMNGKSVFNAMKLRVDEHILEDKLKEILEVERNNYFIVKEFISLQDYSFILHEKDKKYNFKTFESILPCGYLFENFIVKNNKLFCGCDKINIDCNEYKNALKDVLNGNWSNMPKICIECYEKSSISNDFAVSNIKNLNKFYYQLSIQKEFFERSLPDFNHIEFNDDFKNKDISKYKDCIIRMIDKYSDNLVKLNEIFEFVKDNDEIMILSRLAKLFLYNMNLSESIETLDIIYKLYPSEYFKFCLDLIKKINNNERIIFIVNENFRKPEKIFELLFYIERYAKMQDKWVWE
ncbi:MAG: radical SAM protein [Candidatus Muirbacterium halophilum]|nr:radical SAM protein [Candidatus Muirbacterium halophilum]MCK9474425.1 radical SAM protein [Candidatus Muirbacterium halophilum]